MKEDNMKQGWEIIPFEDSIVKVKYTTKVPSNDYLDKGLYPIVSQEEGLVCGYWNNANDLFKVSTPVVIFGDHTRILKYIDFDFVLGADGVKILQPIENINAKFLKYYLQYCKIPSLGYSRHYKLLKELQVPVPPLPVQERIVSELDLLSGIIEKKREQLKELDALAQSIFYDMFGDPITNEKGWEVKKLGEVCKVNPSKKDTSIGLSNSDIVSFLPMEDLPIKACYHSPKQTRLFSEVQSSYTCFANNDVLMAKVTPCFENGKIGIASNLMNGIGYGSSEFIVIRANNIDVIKEYPYFVIQNTSFIENACAQLTGTSGLRRVPRQYVENCNISIPPLPLQHQFATKIEAIEKQKELIKQSISETETLFNERMQEHFG